MRVGVVILSLFALVWGCAALSVAGAQSAALAVPLLVSSLLVVAAWKGMPAGADDPAGRAHTRRLVRLWSLIEVAAIGAAVVALQRMNLPGLIPSAMCLIVGLHFFPLARGLPQPLYYLTGSAMGVMAAISAALTPVQLQGVVALSAGAVILWATALGLILLARRPSASGVKVGLGQGASESAGT